MAEELGIDRRTLWEWQQLPAFSAAVEVELTAIRIETRGANITWRASHSPRICLACAHSDHLSHSPEEDHMHGNPESSQDLPFATEPLSERQQAAVALLVLGETYTAVAEELGIDRRTLWEWRKLPAFSAAVDAELTAIRIETRTRMCALASKAVTAVEAIIANGYTDTEKLAAVRLVFKWLEAERIHAGGAEPI